jgi:hypothetical protein
MANLITTAVRTSNPTNTPFLLAMELGCLHPGLPQLHQATESGHKCILTVRRSECRPKIFACSVLKGCCGRLVDWTVGLPSRLSKS